MFQVAQAYDYDPYGNPIAAPATGPYPDFGYAGMYQHGPSGLSLTHYRAYHPASARWLARDPLGEGTDPAFNLYRYVRGNPISLTDRQGLVPDSPLSFFFPPAPDPGAPPDAGDPGSGAPPTVLAPPPYGSPDDGLGGSGSPDCTNGAAPPPISGDHGSAGTSGPIQIADIGSDLEALGGGVPMLVPTPKGATQFIFPNGMILRFDLAPGQYLSRTGATHQLVNWWRKLSCWSRMRFGVFLAE